MLLLKFYNSLDRTLVWEPGDEILADEFTNGYGKYPYEIEICMGEYERLTHQELYELEVMMYPNNDTVTVI